MYTYLLRRRLHAAAYLTVAKGLRTAIYSPESAERARERSSDDNKAVNPSNPERFNAFWVVPQLNLII